jgi:hypothetical protein
VAASGRSFAAYSHLGARATVLTVRDPWRAPLGDATDGALGLEQPHVLIEADGPRGEVEFLCQVADREGLGSGHGCMTCDSALRGACLEWAITYDVYVNVNGILPETVFTLTP